ncbi:MAG: 4,5-DOPA dioxygenase extradiol [Deltaproteobacteria bacterium RBG_16_71_12]|nr:MAG: 4,5-DOPA dioxygenase extradiol [Deltaproteobacteria bacterium RBG_16_71_12]
MPGAAARSDPPRMPVLFVGHGSPLNAIEDNPWSRAPRALGAALAARIGKPRAVLAISAHWFTRGTWLTGELRPRTIHDFSGFPEELERVEYPAPGDPALASHVARLLGRDERALRTDWGLDHGTWCVLTHLLPEADVPVVQLSVDAELPGPAHLALGGLLAPLRDQGVLILGSGNVTHNLPDASRRMRSGDTSSAAWAVRFDDEAARAIERRDGALLASASDSELGRMAHPTPDHWLPLLYAFGASHEDDAVSFPVEGFDLGALSMRAVQWG